MSNINSLVYDRLKKLSQSLNIDTTPNSENDAEIYAYSRVIDRIRDTISTTFNKLFCNSIDDMDMYIELLDIDANAKAYDELMTEIKQKLAMNYGAISNELYERAKSEIPSLKYHLARTNWCIDNLAKADVPKLHKFIENYKPIYNYYFYSQRGNTNFDKWDSFKHDWLYYDELRLAWSFYDSYKEEI